MSVKSAYQSQTYNNITIKPMKGTSHVNPLMHLFN